MPKWQSKSNLDAFSLTVSNLLFIAIFEVLTAVSLKFQVLLDVIVMSNGKESPNFCKYCRLFIFRDKQYNMLGPIIPRDENSTTIRKVCKYLPVYNNVSIAKNVNHYLS